MASIEQLNFNLKSNLIQCDGNWVLNSFKRHTLNAICVGFRSVNVIIEFEP